MMKNLKKPACFWLLLIFLLAIMLGSGEIHYKNVGPTCAAQTRTSGAVTSADDSLWDNYNRKWKQTQSKPLQGKTIGVLAYDQQNQFEWGYHGVLWFGVGNSGYYAMYLPTTRDKR